MKKQLALFFTCLLCISIYQTVQATPGIESTDLVLRYTYSFSTPSIKQVNVEDETYLSITMPECRNMGNDEGFIIPMKICRIALPPNTAVDDITITGKSRIVTTQEYLNTPLKSINQKNNRSTLKAYPREHLLSTHLGYARGVSIVTLRISPLIYDSQINGLVLNSPMEIEIALSDHNHKSSLMRNKLMDIEWVSSLIDNPEILHKYTDDYQPLSYPGGLCLPNENYDYVIITTEQNGLDHWETSTDLPYNWTSLIQKHMIDDDLDCTLVTIEEISSTVDYWDDNPIFNDTQAHIREFCKDAYLDWGIQYVFIGGDDEWIPARHLAYEEEPNVDSDLYWSNLDNTFNNDHDYLWGERGDDGFDFYSELFIGRITCDEPKDVSNWMTKSFYYADATDPEYLDNTGFYAGELGGLGKADELIDFGAIKGTDNWLGDDPHGYPSYWGFLYGFETWNRDHRGMQFNLTVRWTAESPQNEGWVGGSEEEAILGLREAINNNQVTLLNGVAHGYPTKSLDVWAKDQVKHKENRNPQGLSNTKPSIPSPINEWEFYYNNTKPFFVFDWGCHCGDTDGADDGVLHSMLFSSNKSLAFGCVFNTCYGWTNGYSSTNSSGAAIQKLFWNYFFDVRNVSHSPDNWQLGKALAWAKDTMVPTMQWDDFRDVWRSMIIGCTLFADPAQRIKPPIHVKDEDHQAYQHKATINGPLSDDWYFKPENYQELVQWYQSLELMYPNFLEVFKANELYDTGKVAGGYDLYYIRITNESRGLQKPEVLFVGSPHGDETVGTIGMYWFTDWLMRKALTDEPCEEYDKSWLRWLLDHREIYLVVSHNPWGFDQGFRVDAQWNDLNREADYDGPGYDAPDIWYSVNGRTLRAFLDDHMIRVGCDFHEGERALLYPWSSTHDETQATSPISGRSYNGVPPDFYWYDVASKRLGKFIGDFAGEFTSSKRGPVQDILYRCQGILLNWAYGADVERNPVEDEYVEDEIYGNYPGSGVFWMTPEMVDAFDPNENSFGNDTIVGFGTEVRRFLLHQIDLAQPYVRWQQPTIETNNSITSPGSVTLKWQINGSMVVDHTYIQWGNDPDPRDNWLWKTQDYDQFSGEFMGGTGWDDAVDGTTNGILYEEEITLDNPGDYYFVATAQVDQIYQEVVSPEVYGSKSYLRIINERTNESFYEQRQGIDGNEEIHGQKWWYSPILHIQVLADGQILVQDERIF